MSTCGKAILSPLERLRPERLSARDGEPPFLEPWHAQTMAMADLLVHSGEITSMAWADTLAEEIKASSGAPDDSDTYFSAVLSALERLLAERGHVSLAEIHEREHAWEDAFRRTPHGQPVTLD